MDWEAQRGQYLTGVGCCATLEDAFKTPRWTWVEALRIGGLGGPEGTISDRCGQLRYSGRRILGPCVVAKNKSVRPMGQNRQYLAGWAGLLQ